MVKLFDVDFSDSNYLERSNNFDEGTTGNVTQEFNSNGNLTNLGTLVAKINSLQKDDQMLNQLALMDNYPEYDFNDHLSLATLNDRDAVDFDNLRRKINQERRNGMLKATSEAKTGEIHQNKETLAFGINRSMYEANFSLQSVAIFDDKVEEYDSLAELLRACVIPSEYSFGLKFAVGQRMPFLFCPCCGKVKEYYQDPTSSVKQPYDLCWKCQKQYPNNSFINEVTSVSININ